MVGGVMEWCDTHAVFDCTACYTRDVSTNANDAAVNSYYHAGVIGQLPLPPMERVPGGVVKDTVASTGIVGWRQAIEWLL